MLPVFCCAPGAGGSKVECGQEPIRWALLNQATLRSYNFKQGWAILSFRKLVLVAKVGVA